MTDPLPELYFRLRDPGATVFRLEHENRQRRMEMVEIATVNLKNGTIRPHGDRAPTAEERTAIENWRAARQAELAARALDDARRGIEQMNQIAHWAQGRASDADLESVTDGLLLAMHDLRAALLRRRADRLMQDQSTTG